MYYRIKSRKVVIDNNSQQPLLFCTFINQDRVLLLFKNENLCIVDHALSSQKKVVYEGSIQKDSNILDCKRIKPNVCAILTKSMSEITFVKYINDQQILIGAIKVEQLQMVMNLQAKNHFLVFHDRQFVIVSHSYQFNCSYFTIFNQTQEEFNYNINSKSFTHPLNTEGWLIRPLFLKSQIAFFKGKYTEFDNVITLLRLSQSLENQEIDLSQILQEGDLINDIVAKSPHQYYLFTLKKQNNGLQIQIFSIKVFDIYGKYSTKFEKSHVLAYENPFYMQILEVDNRNNFYLVKSYAHICLNGQIYDNYIEVRNLLTHELIQKVPCNIKSLDFSPSKHYVLDYSQQLTGSYDIVLHIRTMFSKSYFYGFLLNYSPFLQDQSIKKIHSSIIDLL